MIKPTAINEKSLLVAWESFSYDLEYINLFWVIQYDSMSFNHQNNSQGISIYVYYVIVAIKLANAIKITIWNYKEITLE